MPKLLILPSTMSPSSKTEIDAAAAEKPSLSISEVVVEKTRESVDVDIDFLGASTLPPPPVLSSEEEKRLYRKIDRRLMPIVSLMYLGGFLDRGELIPAAVKSVHSQFCLSLGNIGTASSNR